MTTKFNFNENVNLHKIPSKLYVYIKQCKTAAIDLVASMVDLGNLK